MFNKFKNLFICGIAAMALFTGCENGVGSASTGYGKGVETCQLEISLGSFSRQVLPTALTKSDLKVFKISGESARGETLTEQEIIMDASGKGKVNLSYAPWFLTLKAFSDEEGTKQVLEGSNYIDLTNGGTSIVFDMKSEGMTAEGSVSLGGTYTDSEGLVKKYTIGLYDFETGELKSLLQEVKSGADFDAKKFTYAVTGIAPGNYIYGITFYGEDGEGFRKIGYYSDLVRVDAGTTSTDTSIVVPDVILKKPAAPDNFMAYHVTGSDNNGWYTVRLTWDDKSTNEENFIINVYSYSDAGADKTGTLVKSLGVTEDSEAKKEVFLKSINRKGGYLNAGSTTCDIKLQTGSLWDVTIQSQNFAGTSDEVTREVSTSAEDGTLSGYSVENRINRVKFVYTLGAKSVFKTAADKTFGGTTYTEYRFYNGSALTAMAINAKETAEGAVQSYPTLEKDGHAFTKWIDDSTGLEFTSTDWKDVSLTANYNLDYEVTYNLPAGYQSLAASRVAATYSLNGVTTSFINGTVNAGTSNTAGANGALTFTVSSPVAGDEATAAEKIVFDSYKVMVDGTVYYAADANTYAMPSSEVAAISAGVHTVSVCARKEGTTNEWYGYTFTFTLSR